jgi:hypothetical protein
MEVMDGEVIGGICDELRLPSNERINSWQIFNLVAIFDFQTPLLISCGLFYDSASIRII